MKIYNLTFIVDPVREEAFLKWLKERLVAPEFIGCTLLKVADVPGDPEFAAHALSVSLQKRCPTEADMASFREGPAENLSEEYARWAGGEGMTFATVLEELPLG
ncbi:MAG: DUF4286 family protein [Muribaculaceae bacterium]|nr:DUF4286 family protein [Muribaculaceae bacterium]